jgi:hypothetical protein
MLRLMRQSRNFSVKKIARRLPRSRSGDRLIRSRTSRPSRKETLHLHVYLMISNHVLPRIAAVRLSRSSKLGKARPLVPTEVEQEIGAAAEAVTTLTLNNNKVDIAAAVVPLAIVRVGGADEAAEEEQEEIGAQSGVVEGDVVDEAALIRLKVDHRQRLPLQRLRPAPTHKLSRLIPQN